MNQTLTPQQKKIRSILYLLITTSVITVLIYDLYYPNFKNKRYFIYAFEISIFLFVIIISNRWRIINKQSFLISTLISIILVLIALFRK